MYLICVDYVDAEMEYRKLDRARNSSMKTTGTQR